jgi:hypothetical protein
MKRWLSCVVLVLSGMAAGCTTAPRTFGDGAAPLYDDAIAHDAHVASVAAPSDAARDHLNRLPADQVKSLYVACSDEADRRTLNGGEVAFCSVVYDILLTRHFGGDFHRLLAWSRAPVAAGSAAGGPAATN